MVKLTVVVYSVLSYFSQVLATPAMLAAIKQAEEIVSQDFGPSNQNHNQGPAKSSRCMRHMVTEK